MTDKRYAAGQRVALLGIAANMLLMAGKLAVGLLFRSQGMLADGFNSMGDVLASLIAFAGSRVAGRPADTDHPYGHGKAEYLASAAIGFLILSVGLVTAWGAIRSLLSRDGFIHSPLLPVVAVLTIAIKGALFIHTNHLSKRHDSLIIRANAEDHRNDMLLSAGMLIGIFGGIAGLQWLDGAAGLLISAWLVFTGVRLARAAVRVLMDTVVDPAVVERLRGRILQIENVSHIDSIYSKPVGARYIVIVKVSVPGDMTVFESHKIAGVIRGELRGYREIADVVVHINPDTPH